MKHTIALATVAIGVGIGFWRMLRRRERSPEVRVELVSDEKEDVGVEGVVEETVEGMIKELEVGMEEAVEGIVEEVMEGIIGGVEDAMEESLKEIMEVLEVGVEEVMGGLEAGKEVVGEEVVDGVGVEEEKEGSRTRVLDPEAPKQPIQRLSIAWCTDPQTAIFVPPGIAEVRTSQEKGATKTRRSAYIASLVERGLLKVGFCRIYFTFAFPWLGFSLL